MATFDNTGLHTNTKRVKDKYHKTVSITYKVPVPQESESFYFNQESIQVSISINDNQLVKQANNASIHITNKRFILVSQTPTSTFNTFEVQLNQFKSLKSKLLFNKKLRFDILLVDNLQLIKVELKFNNKQDARRRESLSEYLKMATSAIISMNQLQHPPLFLQEDTLPSYFEATHHHSLDVLPPAYS